MPGGSGRTASSGDDWRRRVSGAAADSGGTGRAAGTGRSGRCGRAARARPAGTGSGARRHSAGQVLASTERAVLGRAVWLRPATVRAMTPITDGELFALCVERSAEAGIPEQALAIYLS